MSLPSSADVPAVTPAQAAPSVAPLAGPLNPETWQERPLYGGAITACIPKRFADCSDFRQIPDHQEVWADADTDQSLIIELNSLDESVTDEQAAESDTHKHYMRELAIANEALSAERLSGGPIAAASMPGFDVGIHKCFVISSQLMSKFKESADKANVVEIYLAVLRLRQAGTDLLVSFNVPRRFAEGSSSAGRVLLGSEENVAVIEGVLATLKVRDWGLFGDS